MIPDIKTTREGMFLITTPSFKALKSHSIRKQKSDFFLKWPNHVNPSKEKAYRVIDFRYREAVPTINI